METTRNPANEIAEASKKLNDLKCLVQQVQKSNENLFVSKEEMKSDPLVASDWTKLYKYWSKWEDVEEILEKQQTEEKKIIELSSRPAFQGHLHDHSNERQFFVKPENEKMKYCEDHRYLGNYLYKEGNISDAIEQYKLALSYYDYCFPDTAIDRDCLDTVRQACYCNLSLCYYHQNEIRLAIDYASRSITNCERKYSNNDFNQESNTEYTTTDRLSLIKAYYRRACAFRELDEYELASNDLILALKLNNIDINHPEKCSTNNISESDSDIAIDEEMKYMYMDALEFSNMKRKLLLEFQYLKCQEKCSTNNQKAMMEYALNNYDSESSIMDNNTTLSPTINTNLIDSNSTNLNNKLNSNINTVISFQVLSDNNLPLEPINFTMNISNI